MPSTFSRTRFQTCLPIPRSSLLVTRPVRLRPSRSNHVSEQRISLIQPPRFPRHNSPTLLTLIHPETPMDWKRAKPTSSSTLISRTHTAIALTAGVQQELPGHMILKLNYVGRLGRRLTADADANQVLDVPDYTGGSTQSMAGAFAGLTAQLRAGKDYTKMSRQSRGLKMFSRQSLGQDRTHPLSRIMPVSSLTGETSPIRSTC